MLKVGEGRAFRLTVAGVLGVAAVGLVSTHAVASDLGDFVPAGTRLVAGDRMTADNGTYTLTVQTDGNVVERRGATAVWATRTEGNPGAVFDVQTDGNLVVRSGTGRAVWTSGTPGHAASSLGLLTDGALVFFGSNGQQFWTNQTAPPPPARRTTLFAGQSLRADRDGDGLSSPSGRIGFGPAYGGVSASESVDDYGTGFWYRGDPQGRGSDLPGVLTMQTDGNLVLRGTNGVAYWWTGSRGAGNRVTVQDDGNIVVRQPSGRAVWASGTTRVLLGSGETAGPGTRFVSWPTASIPAEVTVVQADGNVVRYGPQNQVIWTTHTGGNAGARLTLQSDGNLVVRRPDGRAVWQSGTSRCGPHTVFDTSTGTVRAVERADAWRELDGNLGYC